MKVHHYLFFIRCGMVTTLYYDNGKLAILKIGGRETVSLTDSFWDEWREYSGKCQGDSIVFCLIYDEKPVLAEDLCSEQCGAGDCIWSRAKVEKAVEMLAFREPIEICDEHGALLCKAGISMGVMRDKCSSMTAWRRHRQPQQDTVSTHTSIEKMTPMKEYYKAELKAIRGE